MARNVKYDVELGKRIQRLRKDRSLSQKGLVEAGIGISLPTIQRYEAGELPGAKGIEKIIDYYKCNKSWLLTGEGVPYPDRPEEKPNTPDEIPKFTDIFDDYKDLPDDQLTVMIDHLKSLSRNDRKRIISDLITSTRRGGVDALLLKKIYAVLLEFLNKKGRSQLDSNDFVFAITLQTIYHEIQKIPNDQELLHIFEALYALGKVFPGNVPLIPHEQLELFSWGHNDEQV